jgi:hypothetical protein
MIMNKTILKLWLPGLLVAAIAGMPLHLGAQDTNKPAIEKKETKSKKSGVPFHGKLKAVDNTAKTLSVGTLVIQVTSDTKITRKDKPATLEDGVVGENVSGRYVKTEDGKLNALTIHLGSKEPKSELKKDETGSEK